MNLTEQKFWQLIKEHLPGDLSRVENSAEDGMPDVNGTYLIDYWIELKVCDNIEKIRDVTLLLRNSQIVWNIRRGKQGALIFVMVRYSSMIVIYKWHDDIYNGILNNIQTAYKILAIIRKKKSFDWPTFTSVITNAIRERIIHGLCDPRTTR